MEFSLLEVKAYPQHWWVSFFYFEIKEVQAAGLHIEWDQGLWKCDFLGLRTLLIWLKDKYQEYM